MEEYRPRQPLTASEKVQRFLEKETDGTKARTEYRAKEAATLDNMRRLRELRLSATAASAYKKRASVFEG
jgi:hypothetical protein